MMSEDIHKWTDGRYTLMFDEHTFFVFDNEKEERMTALKTTKKLNEQQATIRRLQDLCGKSDGENAKLRIENKRLQELNDDKGKRIISLIRTNKTLKEENRELRQSVECWQKKYEEGTETFQID